MQPVQCSRTSPCAHARHMARRLALLTLLACAVAARHPPSGSSDVSISESDDPYFVWDEYDDSYETNTPQPRFRSTTTRTKVILRTKIPKVNVTMMNAKGEHKKVIKTTNINIHSHTNFIVTKSPINSHDFVTSHPMVQIVWVDPSAEEYVLSSSTKRPTKVTSTTRRPISTSRTTSTRRPVTIRRTPTTRRPATTRRPVATRRPASTTRRPVRTTKKYKRKTTARPPKQPGWLSSFFRDNSNFKREPKKPEKSGWFLGRF